MHPGSAQPYGRGRGHRSEPHVHADARHRETAVGHHDLGLHGHLPLRPPHARGVHDPDFASLQIEPAAAGFRPDAFLGGSVFFL